MSPLHGVRTAFGIFAGASVALVAANWGVSKYTEEKKACTVSASGTQRAGALPNGNYNENNIQTVQCGALLNTDRDNLLSRALDYKTTYCTLVPGDTREITVFHDLETSFGRMVAWWFNKQAKQKISGIGPVISHTEDFIRDGAPGPHQSPLYCGQSFVSKTNP